MIDVSYNRHISNKIWIVHTFTNFFCCEVWNFKWLIDINVNGQCCKIKKVNEKVKQILKPIKNEILDFIQHRLHLMIGYVFI